MLELTTTELISLAGVVIAAFGVGVAVVAHLRNRSFRGTQKGLSLVKSTCPHSFLDYREDTGAIEVIPAFFSPTGRLDYRCQRCGLSGIYDERLVQSLMFRPFGDTMLEVAKNYRKRDQAFERAVKKYEGR